MSGELFAEGSLSGAFKTSYSSLLPSTSSCKSTSSSGYLSKKTANPTLAVASNQPATSSKLRFAFSAASRTPEKSSNLQSIVLDFDRQVPIERASTPPSSWYTHPDLLAHEMETIFWRSWQVVGLTCQVEKPHAYFTGSLGKMQYIICRDGKGELHGFHNVCRHHASPVASGSGCTTVLQCPYHGWSYSLDGRFQKATRLAGIQNFKPHDFGLLPISIATWGPFVLLNFSLPCADLKLDHNAVDKDWLGDAHSAIESADINAELCHIATKEYLVNCNWKVFCDNYLDGGYHVPIAHKNLASGLSLASYSTQVLERVSIQSCKTDSVAGRLGQSAFYAFVYPNFMINRYGPWMDTNLVIPLETSKCLVVFHYFLDPRLVDDKEFVQQSLSESEIVQMEDVVLCEGVQKGLESPAFSKGRYAPSVETAMHHFHCLLQQDLMSTL
ncbi:hypothetical protein GOP47_0024883 [Adiantum capillus-veneris]|uniref:Choline monooxygenase, chloroplastic n=1 Tax=Adiantum capillus-veneris TaxID=13818 RepID=A0A9D4U2X6_ADICA|nr:hypothetical protein GOP47_0024883 [Adiantum capillus-veneris]